MKAATISNKYPQLAGLSAWLEGCRPSILGQLDTLFSWGIVRPQQEVGRGRFRHLNDFRAEIEEALSACGVEVVKMNDAPRGGRTGDIWVLHGEWVGILENGETKYHAVGANYNTCSINTNALSQNVKDYIVESENKRVKALAGIRD